MSMLAHTTFAAAQQPEPDPPRPPEPMTSTLAGSGARGIADGPTAEATFMAPTGVATAPDGSVVVADPAAQNIRRIANGRVTTLAGTSLQGTTPDERAGGYTDGPANLARFDRPVGVATARNGDVYVADAGNLCIRKIANGVVTTFAGSRAPGHADGDGRIAQFTDIRGIAIDDAGFLYVADYGVGIRRVDDAGTVTTITQANDLKSIVGVAARGSGDHTFIAYADAKQLHLRAKGHNQDINFTDDREPTAPGMVVGRMSGITIVNENTLVVTDATTNAVRFIRLPAPPFVTDRMARALAGGVREGADLTGGFADGPPDAAQMIAPTGIARGRDGTFVVADTGNRRIRSIADVDSRESVLPDGSNFVVTHKGYRIAVVGNSYAYFNVLWPESIPGRIEGLLDRDQRALGFASRATINVFRVDDLSAKAARSLVREYLGDGQADLVILMVNAYGPWSTDDLLALDAELSAQHEKLMIVYTPQGYEVSPLDFPAGVVDRSARFGDLHTGAVRSESFYNAANLESVLLLDQMEAWEGRQNRVPLFYDADHHLTIFGSEWVGDRIGEELERRQPWRTP